LGKGIAEGCKESRTEMEEMYMTLCAMYIILFHLYFIITPNQEIRTFQHKTF